MASSRYVTPEDAAPAPLLPDYTLLRQIGRGAYGEVWLARGVTGVFRAVKIVWRTRFPDPRPYEREFRGLTEFAAISLVEARQLALLHVSRNDAEGFFYYVMELADDAETGREIDPERYVPRTLREVRSRAGRLPAAESISIGVELARGLAGMHARNLVHRDIKPSNVIFVGGAPKLADIGLVAAVSDDMTFVGTEGFVPPEGPGTPAADVYSLGKVLYELVTGLDRREYPRLPPDFDKAPDRQAILELNEVIIRACDPDGTRRFKDAQLFLDELLLIQAGRSVRRMRVAERRLGGALRLAGILGVIAAIAAIGGWIEWKRLAAETQRRVAAEGALEDLARRTFYSASLDRAQRDIEVGNLGAARRILRSVVPKANEADLRNVEWYAAWSDASGDPADILQEQGTSVAQLTLSDDGRYLASRNLENEVSLWNTRSRARIASLQGISRIAGFSRDGLWLLGADSRRALGRWSLASQIQDPLGSDGISNYVVGRTGDDSLVAVMQGRDLELLGIRTWNTARHSDESQLSPVPGLSSPWKYSSYGAVSSDGSKAALVFRNLSSPPYVWRLQLYTVSPFALERTEEINHPLTSLCFSNDNARLAYATYDTNKTVLEEAKSGQHLWEQTYDTLGITTLTFSTDGRFLAVGGRNGLIHIADSHSGEELNELRGQGGAVLGLAWPDKSEALFSAGAEGDIRRWTAPLKPSRSRVSGLTSAALDIQRACLSDDGSLFAASHGDGSIRMGSTGGSTDVPDIDIRCAIPLAFDKPGDHLIGLDATGHFSSWDLSGHPTPIISESLIGAGSTLVAGDISKDHTRLVVSDSNGDVHLWRIGNKLPIATQPGKHGDIWWNLMSPDGDLAVSAGENRSIRAWSTVDGSQKAEWVAATRPFAAAFSCDSKMLAIGFATGEIEVREVDSLKVIKHWQTDAKSIRALVFSADGSRLLSGSAGGDVAVFETANWSQVASIYTGSEKMGSDPTLYCLGFSAKSNMLLAFRKDGVLRFWRL